MSGSCLRGQGIHGVAVAESCLFCVKHYECNLLYSDFNLFFCSVLEQYRETLAEIGDTVTDTTWHTYGLQMGMLKGFFRFFAHPEKNKLQVR